MNLTTVKKAYRAIVPPTIRNSAFVERLKRLASHDALYGEDFYRSDVDPAALRAAGPISASLMREINPKTVVDVGCGTGAMLAAFRDGGCDVLGLEYSKAGLELCRERKLNVRQFNIETDALEPGEAFDLVVSMEVAEHLPERIADNYVDLLCAGGGIVAFTAATPGQGGTGHVNEQPHDYWIEKFVARGFSFNEELSLRLRDEWREGGVIDWYYKNAMVFEKR